MNKEKWNRQYLGVTITAKTYREIMEKHKVVNSKSKGYRAARDEINFHNKHLRAYLKGATKFTHGVRRDKDKRVIGPAYYAVQFKLAPLDGEAT